MIYKIQNSPAEGDYRGCGKAWAAIKDGQVLALRYMSGMSFCPCKTNIPDWAKAALDVHSSIAERGFNEKAVGPTTLAKIKAAAIAAGHPATGPRGGYIKASRIAYDANKIVMEAERKCFSAYRQKCRDELSAMGEVVSGMCSCWEFIPNV